MVQLFMSSENMDHCFYFSVELIYRYTITDLKKKFIGNPDALMSISKQRC